MSSELISRSPDLGRLESEGYEIEVRDGYLLLRHVPYVTSACKVEFGTLVSELTLAGGRTTRPSNHVTQFIGSHPCNRDGSLIKGLQAGEGVQRLSPGIEIHRTFSNKPAEGYPDYFEKMTRYVEILLGPAQSLDPTVTAQTGKQASAQEEDSPFVYQDTNTSRSHINLISAKLRGLRIAIVGLGGTGSYVLDLVAKTPVKEIHLFDSDHFLQHNAFRAPGAAPLQKLNESPYKVDYLAQVYSQMHKRIVPHRDNVTAQNVSTLDGFDFVFLCVDSSSDKQRLCEFLTEKGISCIDSGLGVQAVDEKLLGIVRVTTITPRKNDHVAKMISFKPAGPDDYSTNIQIADLNMLNATLAVIKWKKLVGFYADLEHEHDSTYTLDGNLILNEAAYT
jgi:molybdopterin/thiamine biosynthesis adenylyltransferase